jgi:hypothetical protein
MDVSDFERSSLTPMELKVLKSLNKKSPQKLAHEKACSQGIIKFIHANTVTNDDFSPFDGTYSINGDGERYILWCKAKKRDKFCSELRGWITTVIAVAAFIISIISLLKK